VIETACLKRDIPLNPEPEVVFIAVEILIIDIGKVGGKFIAMAVKEPVKTDTVFVDVFVVKGVVAYH
jgi:hypothetical protein